MAVTEVKVANLALIALGAQPISSLTQDTQSAILLRAVFDQVVDEVLRAHPWNFAIKRVILAPTSATPDFDYNYEYDLPADCLRVLDEQDDSVDWVVENGKILSNQAELKLRIIFRNNDPAMWDPMFAAAVAYRLAEVVGYALTQSSTVVDAMGKKYREKLAEARSMDGAEGILKALVADDWTNARR